MPDDVYVYTFVDSAGNYVTNNTPINQKTREEKNSFGPGDLPYDDDFFIFPKTYPNTTVCARFPDGILLFGYDSLLTPIPPLGTAVNKSRLNNNGSNWEGYPDGELHVLLHRAIRDIVNNARTGGYTAALNAKTITIGGTAVRLDNPRFSNFRELIIGAMAYIQMMTVFYNTLLEGLVHLGGRNRITRNRRHHRNKSVSRKSKMTRRKGKGKGKARAMSMLKSAKQRFYGGTGHLF